MVSEPVFFRFVERMEEAGICTRWPAPAKLYKKLCGKQYYNWGCLNRDLRVPVTTRVYYKDVCGGNFGKALTAARNALRSLNSIRKSVWGEFPNVRGRAV